MLTISVLLLLLIVGLLLFVLCKSPTQGDIKQIGYVMFAGAYLALCFAWATKVLHL